MVRKLATTQEFRDCLLEAQKGDRLVAVDFTASWCGPCQMIGPKFEAMSSEFTDVAFVKVDVDENKEVAAHCKIQSMPTFQFWRDCQCVNSFSGADEGRLRAMISSLRFSAAVIKPNTPVIIRDLKSESAQIHNGKVGVVKSYDKTKGRYVIAIEGVEAPLALKPPNFTQRLEIMLSHLDGDKASLNGEMAHIVGFDTETQCYQASVDDEEIIIKHENVVLPDQTCALIFGLKGAPQHNGKWAKIVGYDASSGRYLAQISGTEQLKLKRANMSVAPLNNTIFASS